MTKQEEKTIYLEVDEEITSVVDKLRSAGEKQIFLVIPKRANITQSIVNLKLLKRQAESFGKEVFIVTQDRIGQLLASQVGFTVYKNITDKTASEAITFQPRHPEPLSSKTKPTTPKEAPTFPPISKPKPTAKKETKIQTLKEAPKITLPKVNKKIILGFFGFIFLLFILLFFLILPQATITLYLKSQSLSDNFKVTLESSIREPDLERKIIPAQYIEAEKTEERSFKTTGKKDIGTKAQGILRIVNASSITYSWVRGTRVAPKEQPDLIFRLDKAVIVPEADSIEGVSITAENSGEKYNVGPNTEFIVVSLGERASLTLISTSGPSGGSTKIVNILTQSDYNNAKQTLSNEIYSQLNAELREKKEDKVLMEEAIVKEIVTASSNINVGDEGGEFKLKLTAKSWTLVFSQDDFNQLVQEDLRTLVPEGWQLLAEKTTTNYKVSKIDKGKKKFILEVKAWGYATAIIDQDLIKKDISWKTKKQAEEYLRGLEGLDSFQIDLFPSWPQRLPPLRGKIKINLEV